MPQQLAGPALPAQPWAVASAGTRVRGPSELLEVPSGREGKPTSESCSGSSFAYGELAADRPIVTNLRLPGQYDERLLASVGLQGPYYNWNRWYLPSLGRYMELDPIAAGGGFNGFYGPNWYGYAEGNPLRWTDPEGLDVSMCCRSIQTGSSLDAFADFMGLKHCYIRTDTKTAGMGSCTPGPLPSNPIGTPTCVTDHSSDNGSCTSIPMVNEACVNRKLAVGQSTGPWGPSNNCNTFAASVFWACLDAPLPPWIPSPNPTPWTIRR
jgi:RHS repeat-associated protein